MPGAAAAAAAAADDDANAAINVSQPCFLPLTTALRRLR